MQEVHRGRGGEGEVGGEGLLGTGNSMLVLLLEEGVDVWRHGAKLVVEGEDGEGSEVVRCLILLSESLVKHLSLLHDLFLHTQ